MQVLILRDASKLHNGTNDFLKSQMKSHIPKRETFSILVGLWKFTWDFIKFWTPLCAAYQGSLLLLPVQHAPLQCTAITPFYLFFSGILCQKLDFRAVVSSKNMYGEPLIIDFQFVLLFSFLYLQICGGQGPPAPLPVGYGPVWLSHEGLMAFSIL